MCFVTSGAGIYPTRPPQAIVGSANVIAVPTHGDQHSSTPHIDVYNTQGVTMPPPTYPYGGGGGNPNVVYVDRPVYIEVPVEVPVYVPVEVPVPPKPYPNTPYYNSGLQTNPQVPVYYRDNQAGVV